MTTIQASAQTGSGLPQRIPPQTLPIAAKNSAGQLVMDINWYLFFYNLGAQVLGSSSTGGNTPPSGGGTSKTTVVNNLALWIDESIVPTEDWAIPIVGPPGPQGPPGPAGAPGWVWEADEGDWTYWTP